MKATLTATFTRARHEIDILAVQHRLRHLPAQVGERADVVPLAAVARPGANPVAGTHSGTIRDAAGNRRAEQRLRLVDADPMCRRVQDDGQHQIGDRTGGDDERTLPERLAVEGAAEIGGGNGTLALVEHAHVAAEGQRADDELGAVGLGWRRQRTRPKPIEKRRTRTPHATATR